MRRFDFGRRWRKQIAPCLNDRAVVGALTLGMKLLSPQYEEGDPPCRFGRGSLNGQCPREGFLSWYQPWGRCHHIAPFCWAIGRKLYPNLNWGFISGEYHTVVVGYSSDWQEPAWLMDILLFREKTAAESLEFVKSREWKFHATLPEYAASFFSNPEVAVKIFSGETAESEATSLIA